MKDFILVVVGLFFMISAFLYPLAAGAVYETWGRDGVVFYTIAVFAAAFWFWRGERK